MLSLRDAKLRLYSVTTKFFFQKKIFSPFYLELSDKKPIFAESNNWQSACFLLPPIAT